MNRFEAMLTMVEAASAYVAAVKTESELLDDADASDETYEAPWERAEAARNVLGAALAPLLEPVS